MQRSGKTPAMPTDEVSESLWSSLREFIAQHMGLHFPPSRQQDLQRALAGMAREFGFADAARCIEWLLSTSLTRAQLHALASHLTIGETYFFRERKTFDALAQHVLPELIQSRRHHRRLRVWSAACCTGEEAYSLAILLQQCIPDWESWHITILATDINERFLQKATAGVYGDWSFRDSPPGFKERYFTPTPEGRFAVQLQLKQLVTFAPMNLAQEGFPALATGTQAMDLIFCRNVLMYFTPVQAQRTVSHLRHALVEDGWLVVSPSEASQSLFRDFATVNFPGAILYRKCAAAAASRPPSNYVPADVVAMQAAAHHDAPSPLIDFCMDGQSHAPADTGSDAAVEAQTAAQPEASASLARSLANQGQLDEALACCERWIATDALDCTARYLRAVILEELGKPQEARRSLQQALYLHPGFVLAHFALGNLARRHGSAAEARRHFTNALALLQGYPREELLPESDGLTAGRLTDIVTSLVAFAPTS
jgi:chemotaxis protein methyltransferase CheR